MNAVIETPEEIAAEQARARMLLAQVLDEEKQLLYRLSFIKNVLSDVITELL